jgi:Polyketide cyclase / dehydrase and lipid transport
MYTSELLSRSISVEAPPSAVLGLVGDPAALPRWAPRFADSARPATGDRWTIASGGGEFEIRVRAAAEAGTVDFLAPDEDRGLFARVVPNGEGSALVLTLVMPAATPAVAVERQRAVLEQELQAVRDLCEEAS